MVVKLPTDLKGPSKTIFKYSYQISGLLLLIGLILDWQIGYEMFQRFGALLVGLGVLHYYSNREIGEKISVSEKIQNTFLPHVAEFLPCPIDRYNQNYINAINVLTNLVAPKPNMINPLGFANEILDEIITLRHELPRMRAELESIRRKEIIMVLAGTLIWAFGDLSTNFFIHCNWEFRCS